MSTAVRKRKRPGDGGRANDNGHSRNRQNSNNVFNALQNLVPGSESPRDGARNPIAPGTEYTSLRRITRRLPDEPEHLLDGRDISTADLSWTAREPGEDINPKTGEPWRYPKKKRGEGSNLDDFREEIEQRTKDGQGCKAISEVLIEKGVDTSVRAVARQRMNWGLRQRVRLAWHQPCKYQQKLQ